jgi:uncharacterized protein YbjT (DUF2867 family)/membrane protease YdiL (CAAX protease family)
MTRMPERYRGVGSPVRGDVHEPETLDAAMAGCGFAYYLVHSLGEADFERRDAEAARAFGRAAAKAGVTRIVYLGGLGDDADALSAHLRSRREVETLLGAGGVPVTVLRAGIIVGRGGISWELTRQLVEHLPAMVTPKWVATRTQPIAVGDVVRYLVGVLSLPEAAGRVFEIGGPDVLQYATMLRRVAAIEHRRLVIVPVPLLSPRLSSLWLALVTDVDTATGRALVDSMTNEVVVRDDAIRSLVPFDPMPYDEAVRQALQETADEPETAAVQTRRRRVVAATGLAGAGLLGCSLSTRPGSKQFYVLTMAVAGAWATGAVASGPLHLGWSRRHDDTLRRPVATPVLTGVGAFGLFYGAALVSRHVPVLDRSIGSVLRYADEGTPSLVLLTACANGIAEELFFRGALWAVVEDAHPVAKVTAAYTAVTATTRNPALALAGGVMGVLFGRQRKASGGVQAPALTHLTWSVLMLRYLPPLFRREDVHRRSGG